jgi:hypothetical protein
MTASHRWPLPEDDRFLPHLFHPINCLLALSRNQ